MIGRHDDPQQPAAAHIRFVSLVALEALVTP
jgi:hypothetical protein